MQDKCGTAPIADHVEQLRQDAHKVIDEAFRLKRFDLLALLVKLHGSCEIQADMKFNQFPTEGREPDSQELIEWHIKMIYHKMKG